MSPFSLAAFTSAPNSIAAFTASMPLFTSERPSGSCRNASSASAVSIARPRRSLPAWMKPGVSMPAAAMRGVTPPACRASGSAPAAASCRMISAWAYLAARKNGVAPVKRISSA